MKIVRNYSKKLTILRNKSAVKIFSVKKLINKYIAYKTKKRVFTQTRPFYYINIYFQIWLFNPSSFTISVKPLILEI